MKNFGRATTDDNGRYNARGLRVGGPYSVTVTKDGAGTDTEEGIYLELNSVNAVNAQLDSGDATALETVAVTASRMLDTCNPDKKGGGTSVSGRQLEQIGRAHVRTPVTNAHLVCSLLLEKTQKKKHKMS